MSKFIKPAHADLIVRYPGTYALLPKEGANVPWTGPEGRYWRRRIKFGECVFAEKIVEKEIIEKKYGGIKNAS